LSIFSADDFAVLAIVFVADEDPVNPIAVLLDLGEPPFDVHEGLAVGDVVDDYDTVGASVINYGSTIRKV